ncbi:MAG: flagellar basal-body MS-ring/collar protein FliF [Pseudomonadota bacterium]
MEGILETVKKLGPARLAAMVVVSALLIGFFAFITLRVSDPSKAPLYTDLSFDDSTAIVSFLDSQAVDYELLNNGSTILVDKDRVLRLRMRLAEDGLPEGSSVGYEIFDKTDSLGTTSFVQNINHVRALEGELARTIRSINRIQSARVHLVIPERQLFQREKKQPTASIVLNVRGFLDPNQIRAIQHLVASAIDGLEPGRVSIVDETGNLLASGNGKVGQEAVIANLEQRTNTVQDQLRSQISDILTSVVGEGRARVQVSAELDMMRVTQTQDVFDPEGQVVRSTQNRSEESESQERNRNEGVTVGNELPAANADNDNPDESEATSTTEEVINYEISRTTTTQIQEAGGIKRLSVAVLVDGTYTRNDDGTYTYNPRTEEELQRIATLVRSAIGFNEGRGDVVEVVNLEFAEKPSEGEVAEFEAASWAFTKYDYFRIAELAIIAVLTILVLFLVVRPLLKQVLMQEDKDDAIDLGDTKTPELTDEEKAAAPLGIPADSDAARQLAEAQRAGLIRAEVVNKIGQMVDESPDAAVNVIRNMIYEKAA